MKVSDIRSMTLEELKRNLDESHKELFNLRVRLATRQLATTSELGKIKKKIARINTLITEKEVG